MHISRRNFVWAAAGMAAGVATNASCAQSGATRREPISPQDAETARGAPPPGEERKPAERQTPADAHGPGGPALIASANGQKASIRTMELLRQGVDVLDAIIAGVNTVEDDPSDHSVGLGGLPNEDGVVQLDSAVMHGPKHKAGAVGALERIKNPSSVAKLVMERSDHVLLVGEGALRFARAHGFQEQDLLTDEARKIWLEWKETHSRKDDWLHPETDEKSEGAFLDQRLEAAHFTYGTVHISALSPRGDLASCTSTSGLSWKLPGRIGDSPIIGAGLYTDNEIGSAGSTGRGEANLQNCSSFLVVELMGGGRTPAEACMEVMKRVARHTEKRLRNAAGEPKFDLKLYALRKDGLVGGASMRGEAKMAYHDGTECKLITVPALYGNLG